MTIPKNLKHPSSGTGQTSQEDHISFEVPGSSELVGPPQSTFIKAVQEYAEILLDEASRYEAAHRGKTSSVVQYTSAHFESAKVVVNSRGSQTRQRPKCIYLLKSIQWLLTVIVGVAASLMSSIPGWLFVFIATLPVAVIATVFVEIIDSKDINK